MADNELQHWLQQQGLYETGRQPLGGGCCASVYRLQLSDGRHCLLKQQTDASEGQFAAEVAGLTALRQTGGLRIPEVIWHHNEGLLLEYIAQGSPVQSFDTRLGHGLAELHAGAVSIEGFGFPVDTFCGATRQANCWQADGWRFFTEQRLLYLGRQCAAAGRLLTADLQQLEDICLRLPSLIPEQPAVLLHGDLWRGNVFCDSAGTPVLIDPAVYYGWPEADLAMTRLFGGFSPQFYAAYQERYPLQPGWEDRVELYNLWHLLNHLWMFGGGYLPDVRRVLQRYA